MGARGTPGRVNGEEGKKKKKTEAGHGKVSEDWRPQTEGALVLHVLEMSSETLTENCP